MLYRACIFCTVTKQWLTVVTASLYNINKAIEAIDPTEWHLEEIVLELYHEFLPLFYKVLPDHHPPNWPGIDHEVQATVGKAPI